MTRPASALRLVPATAESARPTQWFCGHCGAPPADGRTPAPHARVCGACGVGLLLEARADLAPAPGGAFLVVDGGLSVRALSRAAEVLLAVPEEEAIDRPVTELLTRADAEACSGAGAGGGLADAIHAAAGGEDAEPRRLTVRPAYVFGVHLSARLGICGPPRAALMVFGG